jgi:CheY-like chemotaxis protein
MKTPMCRLLLIEDDPKEAVMIEQQCCPDASKVAFDVAFNATDAEEKIRSAEFDLIICDLALPADARQGDPQVTEGQRLFEMIRTQAPGTPVYILSGNADLHMMERFISMGGSADLYGSRTEEPLVRFFQKWHLPDCVEAVQALIGKTVNVDAFPLEAEDLALGLSDERTLKIYARTQGAKFGSVSALDGGLSDARTLKLELHEDNGGSATRIVAKIGDLRKVLREADRFSQIAPRIPLGLGAHLLQIIKAGAGGRGALIYEFAQDYTATLGGKVLSREDEAAAGVVGFLERGLEDWTKDAPEVETTLARLRRELVTDAELRGADIDIPDERELDVVVHETTSHRDLHGFNVLVNEQNEPTLIDYGEVGKANAALDPVTLELSILFHPGMADAMGDWPSTKQAESWIELEPFLVGCPVPRFVAACRSWAEASGAGTEELLATSYAYALRQTKYKGLNSELGVAIARGAHQRLRTC